MKLHLSLLAALVCAALPLRAATPPPEKLLPNDTLALITVPDFERIEKYDATSPQAQFWKDPAMLPFKEKFLAKLRKEVVAPLEKELGIKFDDYAGFARGQVTVALTRNGWDGGDEPTPALLFLLDARNRSADLRKALGDLRKKWTDGGKQLKAVKIRDVEFTTLFIESEDMRKLAEKIFPDANEGFESLDGPKKTAKNKKMELTFGQSDTLLIVGSSEKEIERLLIRQSGGAAGALADDNVFAGNHGALFRDALSYGWVNIKTFVDVGTKAAKAAQKKPDRESLDGPQITPEKIMEALGVNGLRTAAISFQDGGDGVEMRLFAGIPASERRGLFKMFLPDAKDAAPPSFVPADVVTFTRYRLDLQKTFASIEALLADLNPQMAGMMKMMMEMAGKDKDPNFDLRKNLIGNMGDDIVVFQRGAKGETLEDVNNRPTVALFSSPNAEQFLGAIRTLAGMAGGNKLKEREFLGRKIYSIDLPGGGGGRRGGGGGEAGPTISLTSNGGYFVLGTDNALLEEYLRGGGAQKSLRDRPGLAEAAQKVGGMGTGLFTYENQREAIRPVWSALKKDGGSIANIFAFTPMGRKMGGDAKKTFNEWLDFSLLPDFDRIARHFNIAVYAYSANQDGIGLRMFGPNPTK